MRNIVYNSKLKKLISKTILVVLLFNFIIPYVALAETQVAGTEITKSNIKDRSKVVESSNYAE